MSYEIKEVYRIPGLPVIPFSETEEEGKWITIRGLHVLIKDGESPSQAFKRTTGKDLSDTEKGIYDKPDTSKNLNMGNANNNGEGKQNMDKIGNHTLLLSPEEIEKSITLDAQTEVTKQLDTQINKLAQANNISPAEVIRQQRYSTDDAKNIISNKFNRLYSDSRSEYDTLSSDERGRFRSWKRQTYQLEPTVSKKILDAALSNIIQKYSK